MPGLTTTELKDWLKGRVSSPSWTVGKLDNTKEQTICVYGPRSAEAAVENVGGGAGVYRPARFKVIVRWGKKYQASRVKAWEVYQALQNRPDEINEKMAYIFHLYAEPIDLGTDENGVYEHAIEIKVITER